MKDINLTWYGYYKKYGHLILNEGHPERQESINELWKQFKLLKREYLLSGKEY